MREHENAGANREYDRHEMESDREPIGFSDLEPDEALVVSLFRCWRHGAPTAAIAAHMLAIRLRSINYYEYTETILDIFKSIEEDDLSLSGRIEHPLLTPEEESLIGRMSALTADGPSPAARPFCVRPPEAIIRSGRDRLEMMIARSYRLVHAHLPATL